MTQLVVHILGPSALSVWGAFAHVIGDEVTRAAYGPLWPRAAEPTEVVYGYREEGAVEWLGWGSLRPSVADGVVWLALGVWPSWQGSGWCHRIRDHLLSAARGRWPRLVPMIAVLTTNERHRARWARWLRDGTVRGWTECGQWVHPAPSAVFFAYYDQGKA